MNDDDYLLIDFENVFCGFDGRDVLKDISFQVAASETVCLLGRSGTGKSVTLKLIIGLLKPHKGRIRVENRDIVAMDEDKLSTLRRRVGFLFQSAALFDSMSLYENLAVPLQRMRKHISGEETEAIVHALLEDVGLGNDAHKMPSELSGGMRKRAGLARALMFDPCLLLADEPISGLDRVTAAEIDDLLLRVRAKTNPAMVIVTHDIDEARRLSDRVAVLDRGSLIAMGKIEDLANSEIPLVRALVSRAE